MILTCPACGTQYVVNDGAIPAGGRQVRCASCRHSWHQDPAASEPQPAAEHVAPPPPEADAPEGLAEPMLPPSEPGDHGRPESEAAGDPVEERAEAVEGLAEAPLAAPIPPDDLIDEPSEAAPFAEGYEPHSLEEQPHEPMSVAAEDDDFSPFARREPPEPRGRGPLANVLLAVLAIAALAVAFWFLAPSEWKQRIGLSGAGETPLQLMMTHSDRQRLASGNELLAISGRVINPTDEQQKVPPITAQLHDSKGKLVHSWTIAPPAPTLQPGASASFNSAEVNVPAGGDELTVTLGNPKA